MIARTWSGTARKDHADKYLSHLEGAVLPEIATVDGHRGAYVLRRGDEFTVLTLWESMDAIRKFAGEDAERAVVPEEARTHLARFDDTVRHFDVVHDSLNP